MSASELLRIEGVSKRFGATLALDDVGFDLRSGEVHALMGENGAGKSTLMKILAGVQPADSGRILVDGEPVHIGSPRDATSNGIAIIHQELNTIPAMTVAENLAIGNEPTRWTTVDRRELHRQAREKLDLIGSTIDPKTELGHLSVGMQQMVEIARAISENARVLVLDEPTAALSRAESLRLFELIGAMRERGIGLVYISHRMEEVWELADRVTVLRDGTFIGTKDKHDIRPSDVVRMMVGRDVEDLYVHDARTPGEVVLEVDELGDGDGIGPVTFDVRAGEVVCLAGLIGAGRSEAARMVFGADKSHAGVVRVNGHVVGDHGPLGAIRSGIGMLPESRKEQALFLDMSVKDNVAISSLDGQSVWGVLRLRKILRAARDQMERLRIRSNALRLDARNLSGGNQQKLVLARWLLREAPVMILDEPTRGVDIGAKNEIYQVINELTGRGAAILMVSSDLPEVLGISDRVLVMRGGRIAAELTAQETTEEEVMAYATGVAAGSGGRG